MSAYLKYCTMTHHIILLLIILSMGFVASVTANMKSDLKGNQTVIQNSRLSTISDAGRVITNERSREESLTLYTSYNSTEEQRQVHSYTGSKLILYNLFQNKFARPTIQNCYADDNNKPIKGPIILNEHSFEPQNKRPRRETQTVTDICVTSGSCKTNSDTVVPICYCDPACHLFNDCCHDNKYVEPEHALELSNKLKLNYTECRLRIIRDRYASQRGYMMVSRCPEDIQDTNLQLLCSRWNNKDIPVTGMDGITYTNVYCAKCHNVDNYKTWEVSFNFECSLTIRDLLNLNFSDSFNLLRSSECQILFIPAKNVTPPRVCWSEVLKPRELDGRQNSALCTKYQNPVNAVNKRNKLFYFRNIFCLPKHNEYYSIHCTQKTNPYSRSSRFELYPMSALFKWNSKNKVTYGGDCLSWNNMTSCQADVIIENYEMYFSVELLSNATINSNFCSKIKVLLFFTIKVSLSMELILKPRSECWYKHIQFNNTAMSSFQYNDISCDCYSIHIQFGMKILGQITIQEIAKIHSNLQVLRWAYVEQTVQFNLVQNYSKTVRASKIDFEFNFLGQFLFTRGFDQIDINIPESELMLNKIENKVKINFTDIPRSCEFTGVVILNGSHNETEIFELVHWSFLITDTEAKFTETIYDNDTRFLQTITTYVVMGLSSVSIIVTMGLHRHLELAVTIPGKISQNLMGTLLLSHSFFMFGFGANDHPTVCLIIGVMSHYLWLCCFTWMTIYAVYVMKLMTKIRYNPGIVTEVFPGYTYIIGYGSPIMIVVPSIIIDICDCSDIKIGYADRTCFPSIFPANLIVFTVPVCITLAFNMLFLVIAARSFCAFQQEIENSLIATSHSYTKTYLRLWILSGASWVLGVIAEITNQDVIRIIFIVLAGSQGLLFSGSILSSQQVRQQIRLKIQAILNNRTEDNFGDQDGRNEIEMIQTHE